MSKTFKAHGRYEFWDSRRDAMLFTIKDSEGGIFEGTEELRIADRKVMEHILKALGYNNPAQMTPDAQGIEIRIMITKK